MPPAELRLEGDVLHVSATWVEDGMGYRTRYPCLSYGEDTCVKHEFTHGGVRVVVTSYGEDRVCTVVELPMPEHADPETLECFDSWAVVGRPERTEHARLITRLLEALGEAENPDVEGARAAIADLKRLVSTMPSERKTALLDSTPLPLDVVERILTTGEGWSRGAIRLVLTRAHRAGGEAWRLISDNVDLDRTQFLNHLRDCRLSTPFFNAATPPGWTEFWANEHGRQRYAIRSDLAAKYDVTPESVLTVHTLTPRYELGAV